MSKLFIFDLDNTLCQSGKGMSDTTISLLKQLNTNGNKIVIASGKPTYYLTGFIRAARLYDLYLIGENGAVITHGSELPQKEYYIYPFDPILIDKLSIIEKRIKEEIKDIFFQPNHIMVTPFPKNDLEFEIIDNILNECDTKGLTIYKHKDTFDILPSNISKRNSIEFLLDKIGMDKKDTISIGDGSNDITMFEYTNMSISIGHKVDEYTDYQFDKIEEALEFLLTL